AVHTIRGRWLEERRKVELPDWGRSVPDTEADREVAHQLAAVPERQGEVRPIKLEPVARLAHLDGVHRDEADRSVRPDGERSLEPNRAVGAQGRVHQVEHLWRSLRIRPSER